MIEYRRRELTKKKLDSIEMNRRINSVGVNKGTGLLNINKKIEQNNIFIKYIAIVVSNIIVLFLYSKYFSRKYFRVLLRSYHNQHP